jgi:hypothetical protein
LKIEKKNTGLENMKKISARTIRNKMPSISIPLKTVSYNGRYWAKLATQ